MREGLAQLHEAGVIDAVSVAEERYHSIEFQDWATLRRLGKRPTFSSLRLDPGVSRAHGDHPLAPSAGLDELTTFLRASRARTLTAELRSDLQQAGVPVEIYAARGVEFWDEFVEIARAPVVRRGR